MPTGELAPAVASIASARKVFYTAIALLTIMFVGTAILQMDSARSVALETDLLNRASVIATENGALSSELLELATMLEEEDQGARYELAAALAIQLNELRTQTQALAADSGGFRETWSGELASVDEGMLELGRLISRFSKQSEKFDTSDLKKFSDGVERVNISLHACRTSLRQAITARNSLRTVQVSILQLSSGLFFLVLILSRGSQSFSMATKSLEQSSVAIGHLEFANLEHSDLREMAELHRDQLESEQDQLEKHNKEISEALEHAEIQTAMHEHASRRFQSLFDGLPVGCMTFDLEGTVYEWNTMMSTIFDRPAHFALLCHLESALLGTGTDTRLRETPQKIQERDAKVSFDLELASENGNQTISLLFFPLHNGQGMIIGGIGCALDRTAQAEAESQVTEMAKFQKAILESTDYAIIATDTSGNVTVFNKAAEEMLGYSAEEVEGSLPLLNFHDQNEFEYRFSELFDIAIDECDAPLQKLLALASSDSTDEEWTFVKKNGQSFPIRIATSELRTENDDLHGYLAVGKDITQEKRVASRLKTLSMVAEKTSNAVVLMDSSGHIQYVNAAFESNSGYSLEEVIGTTAFEFRSGAVSEQQKLSSIVSAMSTGKTHRDELQLYRKDGTHYWARLTLSPIHNKDGRCTHLILIEDDVTEQKEAELKVVENEARFRDIVDASGEYIWETDSTLRLTHVSDQITESLGYLPEDMIGRGPFDIAEESEHEGLAESLAEAISLQMPSRRLVISARTKDGASRWIRVTAIPFYDEDGSLVGLRGTGLDITHVKEAQDALAIEQERVRSILTSIQDCFYSLDKDFHFTYVNDSAAHGFECGTGTLVGKHIWGIHPEPMWDPLRLLYTRVAETKEPETLQFFHEPSESHLEFRVYSNSEGGVSVFYQDVTGRVNLSTQMEEHITQIHEANMQLEIQQMQLEEANNKLQSLAMIDGLTGLKNHRTFQSFLSEEYDKVEKVGKQPPRLGVILMDVDNFKQFNDSFGHPAGDEVLKRVAEILRRNVQTPHLVARYGGEEFVVVTVDVDELETIAIAEEIREAIEGESWTHRDVTVSLGVAMWPLKSLDHDVVDRADKALYESKRAGRNRVTVDNANYQAA